MSLDEATKTTTSGARVCLVRGPDGSGRRLTEAELDEIDHLRAKPGTLVWLNLSDPTEADLALLEREFSVHPLALEDVRKRRQRPKLDTYDDQHMLVAYELRKPTGGSERDFELAELHVFSGQGWLVTVQWGPSPAIEDLRRRFERGTTSVGPTVGGLLYTLLDEAVDSYFPTLDAFSDRIDDLEERVLSAADSTAAALRTMLDLKRELLELRRALGGMRDVANALLRRDIELIEDAAVPYYQDLYDHLVRVLDQVDLYRDLLAAVLEARLTVTSNNLNAIMKRLTAFTVILMVPTLIAGIYGMNFDVMPELGWPLGYPFALGVMAAAIIGAVTFFRTKDWL
ncbi:MAG: magnesium/cobalt transporter CorA [Candidatus Limnocylindria bacterium]